MIYFCKKTTIRLKASKNQWNREIERFFFFFMHLMKIWCNQPVIFFRIESSARAEVFWKKNGESSMKNVQK